MSFRGQVWKTGLENNIFWSEIGSAFVENRVTHPHQEFPGLPPSPKPGCILCVGDTFKQFCSPWDEKANQKSQCPDRWACSWSAIDHAQSLVNWKNINREQGTQITLLITPRAVILLSSEPRAAKEKPALDLLWHKRKIRDCSQSNYSLAKSTFQWLHGGEGRKMRKLVNLTGKSKCKLDFYCVLCCFLFIIS